MYTQNKKFSVFYVLSSPTENLGVNETARVPKTKLFFDFREEIGPVQTNLRKEPYEKKELKIRWI